MTDIEENIRRFKAKERENVAEYGQAIREVHSGTGFAYTIGNHLLGFADFIIDGYDAVVREFLNYMHAERKLAGKEFELGINRDLFNLPVKFVKCADWVKEGYATGAGLFYGHEKYVLFQVVLSDKRGNFPGSSAYSPTNPRNHPRNFGAPEPDMPWCSN